MDLYQIDVTGDDLLDKGYGIIVLYNKKYAYAYRFSSEIQAEIRNNFNSDNYGITKKMLKPRAYSCVVYLILKRIHREHSLMETSDFHMEICDDFWNHENDIIQMLRDLTVRNLIFEDINKDNYTFTKHNKRSKIQTLAIQLGRGEWIGISKVDINKDDLHNLIAKKQFKKKSW